MSRVRGRFGSLGCSAVALAFTTSPRDGRDTNGGASSIGRIGVEDSVVQAEEDADAVRLRLLLYGKRSAPVRVLGRAAEVVFERGAGRIEGDVELVIKGGLVRGEPRAGPPAPYLV